MKQPNKQGRKAIEQPTPFTPGVTTAMVRQHAYEMFHDKLAHDNLTLEDWVLAEKDLVNELDSGDRLEHPASNLHPEGR
jgi:hypothetical protein